MAVSRTLLADPPVAERSATRTFCGGEAHPDRPTDQLKDRRAEERIVFEAMGEQLGAVAIMGLPGAGKTTLAQALACELNAWVVSRDTIRLAMFEPCSFTDAEKAAAFQAVLVAIDANCKLGRVSIVEGMPFSRVGEYEAVVQMASRYGLSTFAILLQINPEVAAARVASQRARKTAMADDRTEDLPRVVSRRFRSPPAGALVLDATSPPEHLVSTGLKWLEERRHDQRHAFDSRDGLPD